MAQRCCLARFQEIGGALEEALGAAVRGGSGPASGAAAAWTALQRCWDRRVFLRPLTHRFWQLCLQVVARYCTAVQARLDAEVRRRLPPPAGLIRRQIGNA